MIKRQKYRKKKNKEKSGCYFCQQEKKPDYKEVSDLEKFTTDRGKILSREKTGVCQKHQRQLTKAIKRARFLALLPFVLRV
jgi:small subunit ribosomal protein S18